ncbi:MAG: phenylalanine--tRNA ligase subunit beta [Candidatus Sungbacteria bacterium]|uniref:Phenylalanine--tRNA ligase beta subunit n=1 Tax=Candidatus Sungiibacteriota bacterium TaxID=2750080 RepID=A0A9D6QTG4_9BACT|nr:phenylalanine--tRNA ligase subunit beta [Candidatus Sungbacteria bacterium]
MKFSYSWLKELFPKTPSPEKTAEVLTFHSFQVESLEKKDKDWVLDIDVLANRAPDGSNHIGVARELAVLAGARLKLPPIKFKESGSAKDLISIEVTAKKLVPRYALRLIENVKVADSPQWLKDRLTACGLRPINNIVDIANYVMLETGQPLHAFDYDKLSANSEKKRIVVRTALPGETMATLGDESQNLILSNEDVVIADEKGAIGLAGIKGGKGSEISDHTTRIALEAANFNPTAIRKTSRRLNLRTDASYRFEHNIDPELVGYALDRAAMLYVLCANGSVKKGLVEHYPKKEPIKTIPFSIQRAQSLLGLAMNEPQVVAILKLLGCDVKRNGKGIYRVIPPSVRRDLNIEADLVEEVGRVIGYDKIESRMPMMAIGVPPKHDRQIFEDEIKDRLAGFGFTESQLSSFVGERVLGQFGLTPKSLYELENPTSPETQYLIHIPGIQYIRSVAENLRHEKIVKIFGLARGFIKTDRGPFERKSLLIALAGEGKDGKEAFYQLKGALDGFLESFGVADHWYSEKFKNQNSKIKIFHPNRSAEILVGDETIGMIAEISSSITEALKTKARIVLAEFDVEKLISVIEREQEFRPLAKYPAVVRDISLTAPIEVRIQAAEDVIQAAGGKLLMDVDLFDVYEADDLAEDMQSIAFHLVFQSPNKTLTDEEVEKEFKKVVAAVEAKDWEVKK